MNFLFIHGAYGSPDENWIPWLKEELEKEGHSVLAPRFPTPEDQSFGSWIKVLDESGIVFDSNLVVVAHSLGPAFVLRKLETIEKPIRACFFIAPFFGKIDNPDFDSINASFFKEDLDWKRVRKNCKDFFVYVSENDPYVPMEKGEEIAGKLGVMVDLVWNAGHFNTEAGYQKFPYLLKEIKKIL